MNFTRETYELMKEDFESDEVRSYRIQLPDYDPEPSTFTIEGLVIELPITMTADDKVTADVVIQITSEVILDVGISWQTYWSTRTPSNLYAIVYRDTEADLTWTDPSGDVPFRIYISTDGVNYTEKGTTIAGDNTYTATGLTAGTLYYFKVVAYNGANESPSTNVWDTYMKWTIDTTKAGSAADTFVLPVTANTGSYFVDWGDGGAEEEFTTTGNKSHTYAASGTYQIKVRGGLTALAFSNSGDNLKLIYIDQWGNLKLSSCTHMFYGCFNMMGRYLDQPNTGAVTTMAFMFAKCILFNQSVANFNTANVIAMNCMFSESGFNQSLANFNTAKVIDMNYMFRGSLFNQSVANFNTAKVQNFRNMFSGSNFKQSLATFSLAAATNLTEMLLNCDINEAGTTNNYDATLVAWAAADVPNSLNFHGGTSKYSDAGGGKAARASLIADDLWTITDGGEDLDLITGLFEHNEPSIIYVK